MLHRTTIHISQYINYNAQSLCMFTYIFVPFLSSSIYHTLFLSLQLCVVISTQQQLPTNSIMHNTSSSARSHNKQNASHTKSHSKYEVFYFRSRSKNRASYPISLNKDKTSQTRTHSKCEH